MIQDYDIVCISTSDWEQPWGSRQQIMTRLSSENRVLFVEYQSSFLHFLKYPNLYIRPPKKPIAGSVFRPRNPGLKPWWAPFSKIFTRRIRNIKDNLVVYKPLVNLPFRYHSKIINILNQRFLLFQLRRLVKNLKFYKILLWIFEPSAYFLVNRLGEKISIYQCIDFFKNEKKSYLRKKCIEAMENKLCEDCDIVFVSTNELLLDKLNLNKETYLVPSAVDESFFNINKSLSKFTIPGIINNNLYPKIGFVGTLDGRIDYELINFIAEAHYDWTIVLLGLVIDRRYAKCLNKRKNIQMLGWIDNNLLPLYINSFDIGIAPYKINEFTKGISPIKVFEYLALAKPVVSTRIPSLEKYEDVICIADNKEDFIRGIEILLKDKGKESSCKRLKLAQENTWSRRVDVISEVIEKHLNNSYN
ncbi:MAG TPA: hypothetical protein DCY56_04905 [Candidatus Omnitrophica bacterium]|nr:hypothetical protein [Candidatus Omnitrophota bacterium]